MANEKKPSIYDDRGTIGSADELDEYGVWVKSEPQDLSAATDTAAADFTAEDSEPMEFTEDDETLSETEDLDLGIPEIEELPDFDNDLGEDSSSGESDIDIDDFSIPEEDSDSAESSPFEENLKIEEISADQEEANAGFTEVSMDDFIGSLDAEPEPQSEVITLMEEGPNQKSPAKEQNAGQPDLSTQLLMKIAEELSSIRSELSILKKEFSGLKAVSAQEEAGGEAGFFGEEDDEKIALTGDELNNILNTADFTEEAGADATVDFSEDLNVEEAADSAADPFPVESGIPETIDLDTVETSSEAETEIDSSLDFDIDLGDTELDELGGETSLEDSNWLDQSSTGDAENLDISIDEEKTGDDADDDILRISDLDSDLESVNLDTSELDLSEPAGGEAELPEFTIEENEELNMLRENGAEPTTFAPAPEDSDYLVNDPLAAEHDINAEEHIDLSGAVIDEPDLSLEIQDNPLEEPSLEDISISLDLSEIEAIEMGPEEPESNDSNFEENPFIDESGTEDISVSSDPGTDLSLIPEGFVVDSEDVSSVEESSSVEEPVSAETEELPPFDEPIIDTAEELVTEELATEELVTEEDLSFPESGEDDILVPEAVEFQEEEPAAPDETDAIFGDFPTEFSEDFSAELPEETEPAPIEPEISEEVFEEKTSSDEQTAVADGKIPTNLKQELKIVLTYMDQLLEALPDDKIDEFAKSPYFDTYKKLFKELGLG